MLLFGFGLRRRVRQLRRGRAGLASVEYAIILSLLVLVAMGAVAMLGTSLRGITAGISETVPVAPEQKEAPVRLNGAPESTHHRSGVHTDPHTGNTSPPGATDGS